MPGLMPPATRDLARTWNTVLGRLQLEMNTHNFRTYLRNTRALSLDGDTLIVTVPTAFACDWLNQRVGPDSGRVLAAIGCEAAGIEFRVLGGGSAPAGALDGLTPIARAAPQLVGSLDCSLTFANYIEAEGNRVALDATRSLLNREAHRPSPVVLTGEPGLGKSHLLHALGCEARACGWSVACLSAEQFTNSFLGAIKDRAAAADFKESLRSVDLLIIDDLQYLEGKPHTLQEVVLTMDAVHGRGGVVAVGSELHPMDLDVPARLKTRLASGFVARLEPFNRSERFTFASRFAGLLRADLPGWALERIAGTEMSCVRVLRGAVHGAAGLHAAGRLELGRLDAELVRFALPPRTKAEITDSGLIEAVAEYFSIQANDVRGRSRKGAAPDARAVVAAALRGRGRSMDEIGEQLSGRHRSTLGDVADRGLRLLAQHPLLAAQIEFLPELRSVVNEITEAS